MAKDLKIKQFMTGSCYSYVLSSDKEALVIDPHISLGGVYGEYLQKNGLRLKFIVDTHTHADHFSLAMVLKKKLGAVVVMHEKCVSSVVDRRVKDGDEITISGMKLKVMHTPGHTDDAITIAVDGMIFTGDVLLIGSVGRTDFQNGSPASMFDTLQRLKTLPGDTIVFPGHDYHGKKSSTMAREISGNPFMSARDKEKFINDMRSKIIPKPFNIDNIVRVNQKGDALSLEMISPKEAMALIANDPNIKYLDVRSAMEFNEVHIKDSINMPIDMLSGKIDELIRTNHGCIVLCRTGNRSPMAADMLIQSGMRFVKVMDGGMTKWEKNKLPVIKGPGGISLERQVRIIAGSLVLAGLILSKLVNPWFLAIPIFVSCGLVFAGLTDNCLMGMLLMKLPYNKKLYQSKTGGGTCAMG